MSPLSYQLGAHVENLYLRGSDSIDAAGNDLSNTLVGNDGANVLDGGAGNDFLQGEDGADVYQFGHGYGSDIIADASADANTIALNADVTPAQVTISIHTIAQFPFNSPVSNLVLSLNGTGDKLLILNFFDVQAIQSVQFADGTVWDRPTLINFTGAITAPDGRYYLGSNSLFNITDWSQLSRQDEAAILLFGSDQADALQGTIGADTISGLEGDDVLTGLDGADFLRGDAGADVLIGGSGNDTYASDILDTVVEMPGEGVDTVTGNIGPDYVLPENVENASLFSATTLIGNNLDNVLRLDQGDSFVDGQEGNDLIIGGFIGSAEGGFFTFDVSGSDVLIGGVGNDTLIPVGGILVGGSVNRISPEAGIVLPDDLLIGGLGDDTYVLYADGAAVVESPGKGTDTVRTSVTYTLPDNVENLLLITSGVEAETNGTGNALDNLIVGNSNVNTLTGGVGNDTLMGGNRYEGQTNEVFSDATLADEVVDVLRGGPGDDTYVLLGGSFAGNLPDTVIESQGEGVDTVLSRIDYALTNNVENLTLLGHAAINGTGNTLDNVLAGNSASNQLAGGTGHDTYLFNLGDGFDTIEDTATAGEGNRILFGAGITQSDLTFTQDQVSRTLTIQVGHSGTDQLRLINFDPTGMNGSLVVEMLAYADGSEMSLASLLGPSITIFGTDNDDVLVGTSGNDGIDAGVGNDTVYANAGDDLILAGAGEDAVSGDEGADTIAGGSGTDYLYGGEGDDVVSGEADNDVVGGEAGNDVLSGGAGNDVLNGGAGADQLNGGEGDDTLYMDAADTVVTGDAGYDVVTVLGQKR